MRIHVERRHSNKENAIGNKLKCSKCKKEFKQELVLKKHLVGCKAGSQVKSEVGANSKVKSKFPIAGIYYYTK